MTVNNRLQWLHKKICEEAYPSAIDLSNKFSISRRQAQRDVDKLKTQLGAPIIYSHTHGGYYYSENFTLPYMQEFENDSDLHDVINSMREIEITKAERGMLQLQLPYTAVLHIPDRTVVLELRSLITEDLPQKNYRCEFQSIELFLGILISSGANIKIIEPDWLRQRLIELSKNAINNNEE
ncbi:MAG: hypothetical protein E7678_04340 [Ruminococcaceae bacterium]|nr:hypothetical protein [Oscillospiraceae bacterium]